MLSKGELIADIIRSLTAAFPHLTNMDRFVQMQIVTEAIDKIVRNKVELEIPVEGQDIGHEAICYVVKGEDGTMKIKQIIQSWPKAKL